MALPEKAYDRLHSLWRQWGTSQEDVYYAIENGLLRVCVWMPMRYIERGILQEGRFVYERHEHKEGFIGVRPQDFHRISSTGCAKLRIFLSIKEEDRILRMAYEPPQPAISVRIHDLVILRQDREKFETIYQIPQERIEAYPDACATQKEFSASGDYHHISMNGEEYHLGDVQARIVEQLHDALRSRTQWVHGKILLNNAGSRAMRLRDVFKGKRDWEKIVESNQRGYYRLNIESEKKKVVNLCAVAMTTLFYLQDALEFLTDCMPMLCPA